MSAYSIADAKAGLPRLIDLAMTGEEVIITRHGRPVAELRAAPAGAAMMAEGAGAYEWLKAGRLAPLGDAITSVELLNQIYDDPL